MPLLNSFDIKIITKKVLNKKVSIMKNKDLLLDKIFVEATA